MFFFICCCFLRLGRSPRSWGLTLIWLLRNGAASNPSPARTASSVAGPGDALYRWTPRMHALVNICVRNSSVRGNAKTCLHAQYSETRRTEAIWFNVKDRWCSESNSDPRNFFFILSLLSHHETKLVVASLHNRLQALCHQGTFFWRTTSEKISFSIVFLLMIRYEVALLLIWSSEYFSGQEFRECIPHCSAWRILWNGRSTDLGIPCRLAVLMSSVDHYGLTLKSRRTPPPPGFL